VERQRFVILLLETLFGALALSGCCWHAGTNAVVTVVAVESHDRASHSGQQRFILFCCLFLSYRSTREEESVKCSRSHGVYIRHREMQLLVLLVQRRTQRSSSLCSADRIVIFSGCFVRCFPATKDLLPFPFLFVSMEAKTEIMQTILYVTVVVVAAGGILLGESASRGALSP